MAGNRLIVVLITLFALTLATQAIAASAVQATGSTPVISWFYLHHRTYQNGNEINRLGFGFKDSASGQDILEDKLESVVLYDPNGEEVTVAPLTLDPPYTEVDGQYNGSTGIWYCGEPFQTTSYWANLSEGLIVGTYQLSVVFDGVPLNATFNFTGVQELPIIPASSIKRELDSSGNLILTWAVTYELSQNNPTLATSVKVGIDVNKNGKLVGYLGYTVPTHLGRLFIPKATVEFLKSFGGSQRIKIILMTNDRSSRTYSNQRKLVLK